MNNKRGRRYHKKNNAKIKQQILRKELKKETKYPLRSECRQAVFLKQSRKRGA